MDPSIIMQQLMQLPTATAAPPPPAAAAAAKPKKNMTHLVGRALVPFFVEGGDEENTELKVATGQDFGVEEGVEVREWSSDGYFSAPTNVPSFGSPPLTGMNGGGGGGGKKKGKKSPAYGGGGGGGGYDYGYENGGAETDIFATSKFDLSEFGNGSGSGSGNGAPQYQLQQQSNDNGYGFDMAPNAGGGGGGGKKNKNKSQSHASNEPAPLSGKAAKKKKKAAEAAAAAAAAAKASKRGGGGGGGQSFHSETIEGGKTSAQWADFCNSPAPQKVPLPTFLTERHPHFVSAHVPNANAHSSHHKSDPESHASSAAASSASVHPSASAASNFSFGQFASDLRNGAAAAGAGHSSLPSLPAGALTPDAAHRFAASASSASDSASSASAAASATSFGGSGGSDDDCVFCWMFRYHRPPPPALFASGRHHTAFHDFARSAPAPYCELCELEAAAGHPSDPYAFPGLNRSYSSPAATAFPPYAASPRSAANRNFPPAAPAPQQSSSAFPSFSEAEEDRSRSGDAAAAPVTPLAASTPAAAPAARAPQPSPLRLLSPKAFVKPATASARTPTAAVAAQSTAPPPSVVIPTTPVATTPAAAAASGSSQKLLSPASFMKRNQPPSTAAVGVAIPPPTNTAPVNRIAADASNERVAADLKRLLGV